MSFKNRLILVLSIAFPIAFNLYINDRLFAPVNPAEMDTAKKWFGPGERVKEDESIKPFKMNVPDNVIADLKKRIEMDIPR